MLVLTCQVGGILRIDQSIQVTFQARQGVRVTVGVLAPREAEVYFDGACLQPLVLPSGTRSYLFSLLAIRNFRVSDIEIGVWLPGEEVSQASEYQDCIHVGLSGPVPLRIGYEQAGLRTTPLSISGRSLVQSHLN